MPSQAQPYGHVTFIRHHKRQLEIALLSHLAYLALHAICPPLIVENGLTKVSKHAKVAHFFSYQLRPIYAACTTRSHTTPGLSHASLECLLTCVMLDIRGFLEDFSFVLISVV